MNLQPLADRVVVRALAQEEKTKSGIVLPESAKEKPQEGEVLAVGPGKIAENGSRMPMETKVGNKVIYSKYAGTEIKIDGAEYLVLRESDVLAIVK